VDGQDFEFRGGLAAVKAGLASTGLRGNAKIRASAGWAMTRGLFRFRLFGSNSIVRRFADGRFEMCRKIDTNK
jgi:hypothetical protein